MAFLAPHSDKARTMDIPHVEFKLKFKLNSNSTHGLTHRAITQANE
jgi:hypothetical protein